MSLYVFQSRNNDTTLHFNRIYLILTVIIVISLVYCMHNIKIVLEVVLHLKIVTRPKQ